jgi:rhodanese-related sulfurtransferase
MRFRLFLAAIAAAIIAPALAQEPNLADAPRIPLAEFRPLLASRHVLVIDVRDAQSFVAGHIPGARSMPLDTLLEPAHLAILRAVRHPIVLYCA